MHNIKLTLAYDGSEFRGWQMQPGQPTVQGTLVEVAERLTQERLQIHAAGRTDAGVHALGQVAHFRTHSELPPEEFQRAFNALLPAAIRVVAAREMGPDFHARWQAQGKTYQYRIFRGTILPPFEHRYVLHHPHPLDVQAMARAAALFQGAHDFTSFAASGGVEPDSPGLSLVREIFHSGLFTRCGAPHARGFLAPMASRSIAEQDASGAEELVYEVRGRSFLRYMVRKMVGTLLETGRGRMAPEEISDILAARDRARCGPTAPPQGLYLVSVEYPEPWKW